VEGGASPDLRIFRVDGGVSSVDRRLGAGSLSRRISLSMRAISALSSCAFLLSGSGLRWNKDMSSPKLRDDDGGKRALSPRSVSVTTLLGSPEMGDKKRCEDSGTNDE